MCAAACPDLFATRQSGRGRPVACARTWRAWFGVALGAVWLMLVLLLVESTIDEPRRIDPAASTGLGTGPARLTMHDPVAALAVDLAEHLPGGADGSAAPLPLHPQDAGYSPADDVQGAEYPSLERRTAGAPSFTERRRPPPGEDCCSADPHHADRPPTPADAQP